MFQNERVFVTDTITGQKLGEIAVTAFDYKRVLNGQGGGSATVMVGDPRNDGLDLRTLIRSVRSTLVYEGNFTAVYSGIITRVTYSRATKTLTIVHKDLWWLLARRLVIEHGPDHSEKTVLEWKNLSLSTIIKKLLQEAMWPSRPQYALPIVLPADAPGGASRKYYGYNYAYMADAIRDLIETDGGPHLDFQPVWNGEYLTLIFRSAVNLADHTWEYVLDSPDPGVYELETIEDAESTTTNAYALGEGTEAKTLVRSYPNLDPTYPAIEKTEAYKDVSKVAELNSLVKERIRAQSGPTMQASAQIRKDGEPGSGGEYVDGQPTVADLRLGDSFAFSNTTDEWLPNGRFTYSLIEFSGSIADPMVTLQFQPTGA